MTPLADAALRCIQGADSYAAAALCIVHEGEMTTVASHGLTDPDSVADSDPVQRCYRTLETLRLDLPDGLPIDGGVIEFRARTVIAFPLHLRLVPIGVLLVASRGRDRGPSSSSQQLLPNLAVALNNALSHERLQRVAAIDTLTGLVNRRFGLERLGEEFSRAVRSNEPLGIVMFDIDHFKSVNDTYGHQAGDRVLRVVADAAQRGAERGRHPHALRRRGVPGGAARSGDR